MNGQQGCIFDLDGTLLNTLDDIADSANLVLAETGYAPHPTEAYKAMIGSGFRNLICLAAGVAPDSAPADVLAPRFRTVYSERVAVKTRPYAGIAPLLANLSARGLPLAVLSNKTEDKVRILVRRYFPDVPFQVVAGQSDAYPEKPDPANALRIAAELGLDPRQMTLIGDTDVDMQTALRAGMRPVGVTWGFRSAEQLMQSGAQMLFDNPEQLTSIWEGACVR